MSLFGYYAWHSFKNQLKKIFKSWVLIFIVVCMLIGGIIGAGAARIEEMAEQHNQGTEIEQQDDIPEIIDDPEIVIPGMERDLAKTTEAIAGVAILALLILFIKGADKNGSAIFLPADVTLLFTSPMKPQAVLAFRTMCTIGLVLFTSIYMLFQIPNLVINAGMSIWEAFSLLLAWFFVFLFGQLIKICLYTVCSTREGLKRYITPGLIGVVGVAVAGFIVFHLTHDMIPLESAAAYINSSVSRYIPIWGWTKGIIGSAFEKSLSGVLIYSGLNILAATAIVYFTWHVKADFYEDAMAKSEETAAILREAQESGSLFGRRKKKDRSDKLLRDDFRRGSGANVFFFKSMYNRRRFATLGYFTKTTFTYLAAALGVSLLFTFVFEGGNGLTVTALVLGVMVFYRTLGNPLETDTKSQYFVLIPEPAEKKIFYSLLGSTVNSLLDLLPALALTCVILRANPLHALAWALFMASIDAYATIVGTFIAMSTPESAGTNLKQLVQIMFIYFGLLPDIALIAIGLVTDDLFTYALIATCVNLLLAAVFFALSTNFVSPRSRRVEGVELSQEELRTSKRTFSRVCFIPIIMSGAALVIQVAAGLVLGDQWDALKDLPSFVWIFSFVPMYAVGLPLGYLAVRKLPVQRPEKKNFGALNMFKAFTVCMAFMYVGNILGNLVNYLIMELTGAEFDFELGELISEGNTLWIIIFVVILGPIVEETIFRKFFIDRTGKYGLWLSVVFSALAFGLFHGNLSQFFYATALGLVFGYIYAKTGRIIYSTILHMCVNFMGSVVSLYFVNGVDLDSIEEIINTGDVSSIAASGITGLLIYVAVILILFITGLIVFFSNIRKLELPEATMHIKKEYRFKTAYLSLGFICIFVYFVVMTVISFGGLV
ncbi:MAG: CPBP family intramembrane metalloprotease [Firmicutes bacterium]|nr:CPBP family intramembrane metalloprotease [Bacillota bacterium]